MPGAGRGGSVQRAPGAMRSVQIATSASGCAAHESGGGGSGADRLGAIGRSARRCRPPRSCGPAASVQRQARDVLGPEHREVRRAPSCCAPAGSARSGTAPADSAPSVSSSGNISECTMPLPAVSHCTSPPPKRAVAPSESEWSIRPLRTIVTVSKPRCGWPGKPGTVVAVVHAPAVLAAEVLADVAAGQRGVRAHAGVALRVGVVVMDAEQERVDRLPGEAERLDRGRWAGGGGHGVLSQSNQMRASRRHSTCGPGRARLHSPPHFRKTRMSSTDARTGLQLRSLVKRSGELELSLVDVPVPRAGGRRGRGPHRGGADQPVGPRAAVRRRRHEHGDGLGQRRAAGRHRDGARQG